MGDYLRRCGARRIGALVAFDDEVAGAFWKAAGYPLDCEIGRRVRDLMDHTLVDSRPERQ